MRKQDKPLHVKCGNWMANNVSINFVVADGLFHFWIDGDTLEVQRAIGSRTPSLYKRKEGVVRVLKLDCSKGPSYHLVQAALDIVKRDGLIDKARIARADELAQRDRQLKDHSRFYVIEVVGDVEPCLSEPFATEALRDAHARKLRSADDSDLSNGLYWLDVAGDGTPQVGSYSGGFLDGT